jgi:hypothetical protein
MDIKTVLFAAVAAAGLYVYMYKDKVIQDLEYYKDDLTFTTLDEDLIAFLKGKEAKKDTKTETTDTVISLMEKKA